MLRRLILILFPLFLLAIQLSGQELSVIAINERLDSVINRLGIEVSYNSRVVSKYKISINRSFNTPKAALEYCLLGKPLTYKVVNGVFVIKKSIFVPSKKIVSVKEEELPLISVNTLSEVVVTAPLIKYSPQFGENSSETIINNNSAKYTPGSGDNAIFNLLKMIPGVRVSGEPSDELIVCGSTLGESRIIYDGIPLFGMGGFNDHISYVNPYLVEELKLLRIGYDVSYGGQIGAISEIKGTNPLLSRPSIKATISTLTANIYASIPIYKRGAISVAYRRTFYDLYKNQVFNPYNGKKYSSKGNAPTNKGNRGNKGNHLYDDYSEDTEYIVDPKYSFSDLNINYSGSVFKNDKYRIVLYGADDRFSYTASPDKGDTINGKHNNLQIGASGYYRREWSEKANSNVSIAYSRLKLTDTQSKRIDVDNNISVISGKLTHQHKIGRFNEINGGIELDYYKSDNKEFYKPSVFISNTLSYKDLIIKGGLRLDIVKNHFNFQPRLSLRYKFGKYFTTTASWGLYNQYLIKEPFKTGEKLFTSIWEIADNNLRSMNTDLCIAFSNLGFTLSLSGYMKNIKDAVRLVDKEITTTDVNIYGGDIFLKYDFSKGALYGSYSITNTENIETGHEIKIGGITTLKPFIFSINYVYGNGFSIIDYSSGQGNGYKYGQQKNGSNLVKPYSRLDVAATYRLKIKEVQLQCGVSLLNLLNTSNIKYSYTIQSGKSPITIFSQAISFTPMLFLEVIW